MDFLTILAAADAGSEGGQFGLNVSLIIAQALNFIIVALLLYFFAVKPILATMEERQTKISDGLQYAEEMKSKLAESEREQAELTRKASEEAQAIVKEARDQAKTYYDQQVQLTSAKVEDMIKQAKQANELDRERMLSEVRQEIAQLVVSTTSKVLSKDLTADERTRFNDSAVSLLHGNN
ncbi:MAG: F0F1 ATP synthase subunit B [Opitutales bacterium]